MLHSVGNDKSNWYRNWLSVSIEHFETLCQFLVHNNYTTHFLDEWYEYNTVARKKDSKKLVLTFDDGYLDNWVYAYPILKKYGLKATIFINPEFVDPSENTRRNLEDVWEGKTDENQLETLGFLNWPEIQAMDASVVIDIQSHSMSHNFYFKSNKIIDIYTGQPSYDWLAWFTYPERKPYYITENQTNLIPKGYPIFENGRALGLRRYFPDKQLVETAIKIYNQQGKPKQEIINELQILVEKIPGNFETDTEQEKRYRYEIFESKRILEKKLNKQIDYLCWPGGGYNALSLKLSEEAGYKASTFGSAERHKPIDYKKEYKRIPRFGLGSFINLNGNYGYAKNKKHLVNMVKARTGNYIIRLWLKFNKELKKILYK
jgi:peptidoglycan/xylan/chitin deacetylase (PgdA/CDA1 family)